MLNQLCGPTLCFQPWMCTEDVLVQIAQPPCQLPADHGSWDRSEISKQIKGRANYERGSLALHLHVYLESESIATYLYHCWRARAASRQV